MKLGVSHLRRGDKGQPCKQSECGGLGLINAGNK